MPYIHERRNFGAIVAQFRASVDACAKIAQKTLFLDVLVLSQFQRMRRRIRRFCANKFLAQLRQKRLNSRRFATLRLKKSLFCALYKGFPAAGYIPHKQFLKLKYRKQT